MSSDYQAIYDAVRSRISGGNIAEAVAEQARQAFDISWMRSRLEQDFADVAAQMQRPFVLLKPQIMPDGNMWCALYGSNLQDGVCGFGETPELAAIDFDTNWHKQKLGNNHD